MARLPVICVEPLSSLVDEKVKILVSGLAPNQAVTLEARIVGDKSEVFESHAYYIADKNGEVDVCADSSLGGTYSGVNSMGLLWSMTQAPGQRKGLRLLKRNVTRPYNIEVNCFDGHVTLHKTLLQSLSSAIFHKLYVAYDIVSSYFGGHVTPHETSPLQPLSSATFQKWYMADGVERIVLKEERFRGTLFIPPGDGPFPGVIDLLGGVAGLKEFKASLLASHGFVTLALDYFTPDESGKVPPFFELEYFEEAADWLSNHPKVLPGGIGVHAICLGSWIALLLASFRSDVIKATVAISPLSFATFTPFKYRGILSEVLPFNKWKLYPTLAGWVFRNGYPAVTEDNGSDSKYSAITPCENISSPVLLIYGSDDLNVNSDFSAKQVYERMKQNGKHDLCSVLCYPGAGHLIEPPHIPFCYSSYTGRHLYMVWEGEAMAHAQAQEDAWSKILEFLRTNLSGKI